ncbi:MAG: hypothetical protein KC615_09500 [Anaerolineae bacterium]|nr:hypothetical protein [Anaerolineae bacterium]
MLEAPSCSVFSEIADFLATNPMPESIISYRLPEEMMSLLKAKKKRKLQQLRA